MDITATEKNNTPLLSIITINYNNAAGLKKTIESVVAQNFDDYEHIIVDGGSKDGSVDVIKEFLANETYARHVSWWCSEKDNGIYNAMNKGIRHARGEWVYMLNSGDKLVKNVLSHLSCVLREHPMEVVYGAVDCYSEDKYTWTSCKSYERLDSGMLPHQGFFSPRLFHEKFGLYDESLKILADWDYALRLRDNKCTFYHIPMIIAEYDESGISTGLTIFHINEINQLKKRFNLPIKHKKVLKNTIRLFIPPIIIALVRKIKR